MLKSLSLRLIRNKEAMIVLFFSVFGALASLLANRFLTEVASPNELGKLYLYLNLTLWITIPATSSYLFIVHHWPIALKQNRTGWFSHKILVGIGFQFILAALVVGYCLTRKILGVTSPTLALLVLLIALGQATFQVFYSIPSSERKRILSGLLDWLNSFGRPLILALGVLILGESSLTHLLLSQAVHSIGAGLAALGICFFLVHQKKQKQPAHERSHFLKMNSYWGFFTPALLSTIVAQAATSAERWGLASYSNTGATALFVQATGLSTAVAGGVNSLLMGYYYPIITQHAAESDENPLQNAWATVVQFLKLSTLLFFLMAIVGWFGSPILTPIFFGKRFAAVGTILPITLVAAAIMGLTQTLTIPIYAARDAITPNLSRTLSLGIYSGILFYLPANYASIESYAWIFLGSQILFFTLIAASFYRHSRNIKA